MPSALEFKSECETGAEPPPGVPQDWACGTALPLDIPSMEAYVAWRRDEAGAQVACPRCVAPSEGASLPSGDLPE